MSRPATSSAELAWINGNIASAWPWVERIRARDSRVWTAKTTVAGDHLLHAHFPGWQSAIVMKEIARISARAPRHLSGLADAKVEQHCHRYGHHDEHLIAWVASSRI